MTRLVHKTKTVAENHSERRIIRVRSDSAYLRVRCIRICLCAKQRVASQQMNGVVDNVKEVNSEQLFSESLRRGPVNRCRVASGFGVGVPTQRAVQCVQ